MLNNFSRRKKKLIFGAAFLILAVLAIVAFLLSSRFERNLDAVPEGAGEAPHRHIGGGSASSTSESGGAEQAAIYYNGQKYVYNEDLSTLLILGVDDPELKETEASRNSSQADMLMLAVFDPAKQSCTFLQLNRDTMCEVPSLDTFGKLIGYNTQQLALAHTYGNGLEKSCENTVNAVSRLLYGAKIDNYFALTMDAIPILNDLVGGVTVTVEDDFSGVDPTLVKGETVRLTAENVEHFVRTRREIAEDPTNINRMRRQAVYLRGLTEEMKRAYAEDGSFVLNAYSALADSLVTDCTVDELSAYADRFSGYALAGIVTPEGEAVGGEKYMEFYVDEAALQQLVIDLFYTPVE